MTVDDSMEKTAYGAYNPYGEKSQYCTQIEQVLEEFYSQGERTPYPVLMAVLEAAKADVELIVPVMIPWNDPMDEYATEEPYSLYTLEGPVGEVYAAFTDETEFEKGEKTGFLMMHVQELLTQALDTPRIAGVVLNPFGRSCFLDTARIMDILRQSEPPTEDILELKQGVEAYRKGDYETAVAHYKKAAAAGNVTAMSNLGFCYYYGRFVPVDKEKARQCWEKAAIFGDVPATYKMGDMYRNGDLTEDYYFARALYRKAYVACREVKDPGMYPDVCLRLLQFCRDELDRATVRMLAEDAVEGFTIRVESGDGFARRSLREAMEILEALPKQDVKESEFLSDTVPHDRGLMG